MRIALPKVVFVVWMLLDTGRPDVLAEAADVTRPGVRCSLGAAAASPRGAASSVPSRGAVAGRIDPIGITGGRQCRAVAAPGWGQRIDPDRLTRLAGRVAPAVDPATAPSFDDVAAFCAAHPDFDSAPPLLALPATATLPGWCDEAQAFASVEQECGPLPVAVVAAAAAAEDPDGSATAPFATIGEAVAACDGPCHVLVAPGLYREHLTIPRCTVVEGGYAVSRGVVTSGASRPRIEGSLRAEGDEIVIARVEVAADYGALTVDGDVLVTQSVLRGGYEAGSAAWGATGPRICASHLAGGYGGFDIAWRSSRLWIAGSAISACYEGAALSWGSSDLLVLDSSIYGRQSAVGTSWGSFGVEVRGSRLRGEYAAVDVHLAPDLQPGPDGSLVETWPDSFDVDVSGNRVRGALPAPDAELGIRVHGNVTE